MANVAMMCGCPIGNGLAWIPDDFTVTAAVERIGSGLPPTSVGFTLIQTPSIGTGTVTFFIKP